VFTRKTVFLSIAIIFCVLAGAAALSGRSGASAGHQAGQPKNEQPQGEQAREGGLTQVETKYVCMINNQRFNKVQIPVEVKGRTYYGCCEMCKGKLSGDPASRVAVDPVSGKEVDKAKAVIGADADGSVFYFENAENLKRYKAGPKS
jgi:YHS domain-containing protein